MLHGGQHEHRCHLRKYRTSDKPDFDGIYFPREVCRSFLTSPEVPFNNHLVLLLVPSCDDEIVLGADEPQELFKPAKREQTVKADSTDQAHYKVPTHTHPCLTSRLSWPSEWWSLSGLLSGSAVFFSQLISWPLVTLS